MTHSPATDGPTTDAPAGGRTVGRRGGALRVGTVLLLVAIVPISGIALVSISSIRQARDISASASIVDDHTRAALEDASLEAAVAAEMYEAVSRATGVAPAVPSDTGARLAEAVG